MSGKKFTDNMKNKQWKFVRDQLLTKSPMSYRIPLMRDKACHLWLMEGVDKKGPHRILWNKLTCPLVTPVTTRRSEVGGSSPTCRSHDKSATTVPDRLMLRTSHLELPNLTILEKKNMTLHLNALQTEPVSMHY